VREPQPEGARPSPAAEGPESRAAADPNPGEAVRAGRPEEEAAQPEAAQPAAAQPEAAAQPGADHREGAGPPEAASSPAAAG
jgi:hypothetical protein